MPDIDAHQARISAAIFDLLAYAAVFRLMLTQEQIFTYLSISTSEIPLKKAVSSLLEQKKIIKINQHFGLPRFKYPNPHNLALAQKKLLSKARLWAQFFGVLPFVKSVVVVSSAATGNVDAQSDIDLLILVRPARIYIAKSLLSVFLALTGQLEDRNHRANRFSLKVVMTTTGFNAKKDVMATRIPHQDYWLAMARPVYGEFAWYDYLQKNTELAARFPNFNWPTHKLVVYGAGWGWLDPIDGLGYRRHLKRTAAEPKNHTEKAFVRIRPDIINLHPDDQSTKIATQYHDIVARYGLDT